ncbi:alpha/beta-hydrolase [Exidia glandulosa HHB12029]|uniref:Alpha/beta-hydrolase n=1 Tax=Exidia glandulosa HHB12029 TaxID=1314781 RepID=A0A165BHT3_EXIGL|nr:alpha/beta-hydrolase [Exidia glandulosa HHB12029]
MVLFKALPIAPILAYLGRPAHTFPTPRCTESLASVTASATNFDLSSGSPPENATVPVTGTFNVKLRFCEPTVHVPGHADTLQILVHGLTYSHQYMDPDFEPDTYSWVHWASAHGYATLNMDRLGYGESDHPDPVTVVQNPFGSAFVAQIIRLARDGGVAGAHRPFKKIVYVGHSFGSGIGNEVISTVPDLIDGAILTGVSCRIHKIGDPGDAVFPPANEVDPVRFGDLPSGYVTSVDAQARAADFYGPEGTFDPAMLAFDEAHKDTAAFGEFASVTGTKDGIVGKPAPDFKGDVFTVAGDSDHFACTEPKCANLASEEQFYPAARSFEYAVIPNAGHCINLHFTAPILYEIALNWLDRHGY